VPHARYSDRWATQLTCTPLPFSLSSFSRKVRLATSGRPQQQIYLHSFHLLAYASPTHRYLPRLASCNEPRRQLLSCPILCLSHSFYIILHFIIFFNFPVDYLVRCGFLAFPAPNLNRANSSFVILLYPSLAHCPHVHPCHCCSNLFTTSNSVHNYICHPDGVQGCFH